MNNYEILFGNGENSYQILSANNPYQACILFLREYFSDLSTNDYDSLDILDETHHMFLVTILDGKDIFCSHIEIPLYDVVAILSLSAEL